MIRYPDCNWPNSSPPSRGSRRTLIGVAMFLIGIESSTALLNIATRPPLIPAQDQDGARYALGLVKSIFGGSYSLFFALSSRSPCRHQQRDGKSSDSHIPAQYLSFVMSANARAT